MRKLKLWEWITCLTIVAFIAAVIFPVYACACKKATPATACISNTKQIAIAILMYLEDADGKLPSRDRWMDAAAGHAKNSKIFIDPEVKLKGGHGYAFGSRLSDKQQTSLAHPGRQPMVFDSINLGRNASDPFASLPNPGRHKGQNSVGYLDGHVKRIAWPAAK